MKTNVLFILSFLYVLFSVSACNDQDSSPTTPAGINTPAELRAALDEILVEQAAPGFALSIVSNNAVVFQEAFGQAKVEDQVAFSNQTVQHLASVSKTFVGVATAKAISMGYFDLDTDINELLPVTIINPKQPTAVIRVKHLLTHTSGILDNPVTYFPANYSILPGEDMTTVGANMLSNQLGIEQRPRRSLEDYLADFMLPDGDFYSIDNFADAAPGSQWAYSNLGTSLMAYIVEQSTEQPFYAFVREQILNPLDMAHSTYQLSEVDMGQLSNWYLNRNTPFPYYDNDSYVEGNLFTTNEDMGLYLLDMVRGSRGESSTLFSPEYYEMIFSELLANETIPAGYHENHGFFWFKENGKYHHGGNDFGVSAYLEVDPSRAQGYSFMTNLDAVFDQQDFNRLGSAIDAAVQQFMATR